MFRSAGLVVVFVLAACTRLNPAFGDDESAHDETTSADTSSTLATSEGPLSDLPTGACEGKLGVPLELHFSTTDLWANACPLNPLVEGVLEIANGGFVIRACPNSVGCAADCLVVHPIDAAGFDFSPMVGTCVVVEAGNSLAADAEGCSYGALSVLPKDNQASPFFVATTASSLPTALATAALAGWPKLDGPMGQAEPVATCSCPELGVESSCCVDPSDDVALYSFLLGGGQTIAQVGTYSDYYLAGSTFDYSFYNAMAQRVGTCSNGQIETSWKLFATGGF